MSGHYPEIISEPEWDRALWWMVIASGVLHVVGIAVLLVMPHSFLHRPPALVSYSVDLVAPEKLGGTNMIEGGKGRVEKAPLAAAPPVPKVEPPPPPPKVEEPKPEVKPEPPKPEPPKPEPKEVAKVEPKPEPPKVEEKPRDEVALAVKKVEAPPTVAPLPQPKPPPAPKIVAKVEPAKPPPPPAPKADVKAAKEAAAAKERDDRIAAAVKRVEQRAGARGAGSGSKPAAQPGGPISVGPGEGAGGTVKGVEYLLYYNQIISTIKQRWAWAETDRRLEAVVRFNITETGDVLNVRITKPSGDASFDASVERAVRAVNPLPPPPEGYRKEFSDVELTFTPETAQ